MSSRNLHPYNIFVDGHVIRVTYIHGIFMYMGMDRVTYIFNFFVYLYPGKNDKQYIMSMIKSIFHTGNYPQRIDLVLFILRVAVGAFMLTHGWGKFVKLIAGGPYQFSDPIGIGVTASLALTVFAEFICSILLIFGLATRLAVIPIMVAMAVAAFIVHGGNAFNEKELALLYLVLLFSILIAGAGRISIDYFIAGANKKRIRRR